jgi:hypothetical protein
MPSNDLPAMTRLYQLCEPLESLHPEDPRSVDFDPVRGDENVEVPYARSLRRVAADRPGSNLFTGHCGVGKTSELLRLQDMLEAPGDGQSGLFVVYCDVSDWLGGVKAPDLKPYATISTKCCGFVERSSCPAASASAMCAPSPSPRARASWNCFASSTGHAGRTAPGTWDYGIQTRLRP